MKIDEIIDFLETETLSVTFTPTGLKYLSLKDNNGEEIINLKTIVNKNDKNSKEWALLHVKVEQVF